MKTFVIKSRIHIIIWNMVQNHNGLSKKSLKIIKTTQKIVKENQSVKVNYHQKNWIILISFFIWEEERNNFVWNQLFTLIITWQ